MPIEASGASDWASQTTIRQIREAREYKDNLLSVFLVSRIIPNTVISRSIRDHVADYGIPLLKATVANRVPYAEALTMGKTIFEWAGHVARPPMNFQLLWKKSEPSMSAKSLEKPQPKRQPTPQQIDAYVKTGTGKDTVTQSSVPTAPQVSVKG